MSENLNRALILLAHLSAAKRSGVTVAQLIEQTGLASSTVYRLAQALVLSIGSRGYVGMV